MPLGMIGYRRNLLPSALLFIALGCISCGHTGPVNAASSEPASEIPNVAVTKASQSDFSQDLVLTAEFRPYQEVDIMAKVSGYVKTILVDAGDRIKQGQVLAILEVPELADDVLRAEAATKRSQAEVERARDELRRAESSHQIQHLSFSRLAEVQKQRPGLVAQQEVDNAQSGDLAAEAQVAAAQSNIAVNEHAVAVNVAELDKVKTLSDYTRVVAPFDGVVTRRFADTGSLIQAGTSPNAMPLVKVSQNGQLRLIVPVPESAVPSVHLGQVVEVRVPTLNRTFSGRVARFANEITTSTRTMDTEVDVPNPNLVLVPGMFAEVHLMVQEQARVLAVPLLAVDPGNDESSGQVAVVTSDNRVEFRKVTLGAQNATSIQIKSGLQAGDLVVMANRASLRAGETVHFRLTSLDSE